MWTPAHLNKAVWPRKDVTIIYVQSCPALCDPMDYNPPGSSVMGFSRQEYWSGLPFPSSGDLPDPGIKPMSPALPGDFFLPLSLLGGPPSPESFFRKKRWTGAASMHWAQCSYEIPTSYGREGGAAVLRSDHIIGWPPVQPQSLMDQQLLFPSNFIMRTLW